MENKTVIEKIWDEFEKGQNYKDSIGDKGIYSQTKINERFFVGNQWYGITSGNDRPLTRRNIIKRIGEYKIAAIGAAPIAVNYSADGIPDTTDLEEEKKGIRQGFADGKIPTDDASNAEISVVTDALSDYFITTSERLKFDLSMDQLLRNAYISGTGLYYTYWDDKIITGLYADEGKTKIIKGDINGEVIDVENVVFGDGNCDDVESQPYIIIAQRMDVDRVKRLAEAYNAKSDDITPDDVGEIFKNSGDIGEQEPDNSRRVTVVTKFFKVYDGDNCTVHGTMITKSKIIRDEWDMKIHRYPIAKFNWERRRSCAYGESEITYQIPNQIALNRSHTVSVWAQQLAGMPKLLVNGDVITADVTNDPGEIIKIYGTGEDLQNAMKYIVPPNFGSFFETFMQNFASNMLTDAGATDAALGQIRPDNAAAIIQAREAATAPMQTYQNRYYAMIEDIARIWADFWVTMYGKRSLKVKDSDGVRYLLFDADRYKNLVITAKIDVGSSTLYSVPVVIATLDALLSRELITFEQYLERVPKGMIPNAAGLLSDIKAIKAQAGTISTGTGDEPTEPSDEEILAALKTGNPEAYAQYMNLNDEEKAQALNMTRQGGVFDDGERTFKEE